MFVIYAGVINDLLLYALHDCTFKYGIHHLFISKQKKKKKKVNDICYLELMQLLKILVSCVAKYCHLNLGKLVFEKRLIIRA